MKYDQADLNCGADLVADLLDSLFEANLHWVLVVLYGALAPLCSRTGAMQ